MNRVFGGLNHYARCSGVGCVESARGYLGGAIPVCAEHLHAARDHLVELAQLPARPPRALGAKDPDRAALVYYGQAGDRVKIGSTYSPGRRWRQLREEHGEFRILVVEPGGQAVELQRHAQFIDLRVGATEWFTLSTDLQAHIATLQADRPDWRDLVEAAHQLARAKSKLRGAVRYQ